MECNEVTRNKHHEKLKKKSNPKLSRMENRTGANTLAILQTNLVSGTKLLFFITKKILS